MSSQTLTVGVSTYFVARWLSPRLMSFVLSYPDVQLRIQPMIQFSEQEMQDVDLAIRWGDGRFEEGIATTFLPLRSYPVGGVEAAEQVKKLGLKAALKNFTLLRDRDDSNAWSNWLNVAELPQQNRRDALIVADPNVRVQIVIDGQGVALMDDLVSDELESGKLHRLSDLELPDYGYFIARPQRSRSSEPAQVFSDWLQSQA